MRKFLAWESILEEKEKLDLSPHQVKQAETQKTAADGAVTARLPETYQWLLVPTQANPQAPITWQTIRLSGQDALAERASKKLKNDELLVVTFAASRLRMEMDRVPLWRGNHVAIRQLVDDFGRYLYLPRLQNTPVLLNAIRAGLALLTWEQDAFAYAESYDESAARYRGLRSGAQMTSPRTTPACSCGQRSPGGRSIRRPPRPSPLAQTTANAPSPTPGPTPRLLNRPGQCNRQNRSAITAQSLLTRRASGAMLAELPTRLLLILLGSSGQQCASLSKLKQRFPAGTPDNVVRTVTENSRTLKFASNSGFEAE